MRQARSERGLMKFTKLSNDDDQKNLNDQQDQKDQADLDEPRMTIKEAIDRGHFHFVGLHHPAGLPKEPEMSEEEQQAAVFNSLLEYKLETTP
jgi:hypothetical protein